jgi:hypothetical protein
MATHMGCSPALFRFIEDSFHRTRSRSGEAAFSEKVVSSHGTRLRYYGPEFTSLVLVKWTAQHRIDAQHIEPGKAMMQNAFSRKLQ